MIRELVLDTETTGLDYEKGHRIVEIGIVELENHLPTGSYFHCYLNPERDSDKRAQEVHGLTREFLNDKPKFSEIADKFMDYLADSKIIIHNASFDIGFIYALIASISYGIAVNMVEPLIKKYDSLIVIKMVIRYALLISLLMLGPTASFKLPTAGVSLIPMLILGIGSTGIAFLTYYKLLESVGRISSSFIVYMIPIFSIYFGYQFLNEITNSIQFLGIGVILTSAFLYSRT